MSVIRLMGSSLKGAAACDGLLYDGLFLTLDCCDCCDSILIGAAFAKQFW